MKNTKKANLSLFDLDPNTMICLYQINLRDKGNYLFHAGENGYAKNITFNNQDYDYTPIKVEGFEMHGDGRLPRPKMTFSNHKGNVSIKLGYFNDFINYKVTRIKTFLKYLDNVNFPNQVNPFAEPDPDASFAEDVFYVNHKVKETDELVEFELVSLLELETASIPARKMYSNTCQWKYRSVNGCGYMGKPIADKKNKRFVKTDRRGAPVGYSGDMVGDDTYFERQDVSIDRNFDASSDITVFKIWSAQETYNRGSVVKIVPFDHDSELNPASIYVCINDNVTSHPVRDSENWVLDECDRTVCGCRLRYSTAAKQTGGCVRNTKVREDSDNYWTEEDEGLPFGGFPGIDPYEFK